MLQTFRETEVPLRDMETRRKYKHQLHDSSAIITVCQVLRDTLNMKDSAAQDVQAMLNGGEDMHSYVIRRLRWPIQILELLICNQENALTALKQTSLIYCINEIFASIGIEEQSYSADTAQVVKIAARILATIMNHQEAKQ